MQASQPLVTRLCMLGPGHVGKSALTLQFMYDEFVEDYEPTKCSAYQKRVQLDGVQIEVHITDTAGQEDYVGISDPHYRSNEGFLVVFSLTDAESFKAIPPILERIAQCRGTEPTSVILLGNKVDLDPQREVSNQDAANLAREWRIPYIETSAKTCYNLEEAFTHIIREVSQSKMSTRKPIEQVSTSGSSCCVIL